MYRNYYKICLFIIKRRFIVLSAGGLEYWNTGVMDYWSIGVLSKPCTPSLQHSIQLILSPVVIRSY